jgi:hypothetical protein
MARRAPLKATGEPRAPTFNTSELLQTGRASPGWALKRSGRRLTGTFGRPGGKLLSEHIEVESGKNNDLQRLQVIGAEVRAAEVLLAAAVGGMGKRLG